ncbi:type I-E CRISPR-associated protein Cse2/CasB [Endozoicomonas atrinae]|uniref:type I-E CRISPR-associated protein Cse2/CasB n=1 Tax=Endozoicomonas atrinae TaxID=1333660 RepID=UPI003B000FCF
MESTATEHSQLPSQPMTITREARFVTAMIERCQKDKGAAARLRRADNPATEYQSWELLAAHGVNLEKDWERLPFLTVAAAIARSKSEKNGQASLGCALAHSYEGNQNSDQGKVKLRRLLACHDLTELVRHLRPLLALIQSKNKQPLDYQRLLKQLRQFSLHPQRTKVQWAQEFYGQVDSQSEVETSSCP